MPDNRVLGRIFESSNRMGKIAYHSSPNIIRVSETSTTMGGTCSTRGETKILKMHIKFIRKSE
jgi:hypothetical protein